LISATADLHVAVSRLLMGWPLDDVEMAAWEFALDGWQRTPPLVSDYDVAFEHYLVLVRHHGRRNEKVGPGIDALAIVMEELRNRVQFLQTRAGDIRISTRFDHLVATGFERLVPSLEKLLSELQGADRASSAEKLEAYSRTGEGALLASIANAVARRSPEVGAAIASLASAGPMLQQLVSAIPGGVAGNAFYDGLKVLLDAAQ
jgi:hypothetical protein